MPKSRARESRSPPKLVDSSIDSDLSAFPNSFWAKSFLDLKSLVANSPLRLKRRGEDLQEFVERTDVVSPLLGDSRLIGFRFDPCGVAVVEAF